MYPPGVKTYLGDWSSILGDILNTGEQVVRDVRTPVYTNPAALPTIYNPAYYPQTSSYTLPLLIGGAALLLFAMTRRRS